MPDIDAPILEDGVEIVGIEGLFLFSLALAIAVAIAIDGLEPEEQPLPVPTPRNLVGGRHSETLGSILFRRHPPGLIVAGPDPELGVAGLAVLVVDSSHKSQDIGVLGPGQLGIAAADRCVQREVRALGRLQIAKMDPIALALRRRDGQGEQRCLLGKGIVCDVFDGDLVSFRQFSEHEDGAELFLFLLIVLLGLGLLTFDPLFPLHLGRGLLRLVLRLFLRLIPLVGEPAAIVGEGKTLDLVHPDFLTGGEVDQRQAVPGFVVVGTLLALAVLGFLAFLKSRRDRRCDPSTIPRDLGPGPPLDTDLGVRHSRSDHHLTIATIGRHGVGDPISIDGNHRIFDLVELHEISECQRLLTRRGRCRDRQRHSTHQREPGRKDPKSTDHEHPPCII